MPASAASIRSRPARSPSSRFGRDVFRPWRAASRPAGREVLTLAYVLSGLLSSLAAIIYVAHLGQARSDAGLGYELDAITAPLPPDRRSFGLWRTRQACGERSPASSRWPCSNGLHWLALLLEPPASDGRGAHRYDCGGFVRC